MLPGALSVVLPGTGSLYAGNTGHGVRHLVAVPVIVGATWLGLHLADKDAGEAEAAEYAVLLGGAALLLANGIWSLVTAVSDAHDRNRVLSAGPLQVQPGMHALGGGRLGIAVGHVRF